MERTAISSCAGPHTPGHSKHGIARRNFLQAVTAATGGLLVAAGPAQAWSRQAQPGPAKASKEDERLLDEIERRACLYFYEQADPATGLVRDRARMEGIETRNVASIAGTGFGLSSLAIADHRHYLSHGEAKRRVERTLEFLASPTGQKNGFFYHFLDASTGRRAWASEISSVDTAWLLCGVLHVRAHWRDDAYIHRLASEIFDRVDWRWMLNGGTMLCHGWTPEHGFLPYRWDSYCELLAMYLLAIGSPSSPIPAASWNALKRPVSTWREFTYIEPSAPLFVHQYSHAWFDFRGRRDRYADYFENSKLATAAHRELCVSLSRKYPWYGREMWGVTASDSPSGYRIWCSPDCPPDGTLVPCAAGGSLPFLPENTIAVLRNMLGRYGNKAWGRYGFVDAFQPGENWFNPDVIAINQGIMLLMAENTRSGLVWKEMMSNPETRRGMDLAGFSAARA